jgi:predicted aspartyl protease
MFVTAGATDRGAIWLDGSWSRLYGTRPMNSIFPAPFARRFVTLLLAAIFCCSADARPAKSPISLDVLHRAGYGSVEMIEGGPNRLYVPAEINGRKIRLLVDTGWSGEGITLGSDPAVFGVVREKGVHVGISVSGAQTALEQGTARSVVMGNVQIRNTPILFGKISEHGVVGHGFLKRNNAIIDLTNRRLYLRPSGKGRRVDLGPALTGLGMRKVSFTDASHGSYVINIEINGSPTQMALDTGAQLTVLDRRFAQHAKTRGWGRRDLYQHDAAGVKSDADFADAKTFKIEGIPIRTPTVAVGRFAGYDLTRGKMVGLLGMDVLGMNWGIIDVAQQKFYFVPAN